MKAKVTRFAVGLVTGSVVASTAVAVVLMVAPGDLTELAHTLNTGWKLVAAVGCFLAAAAFGPGDYLRRAWAAVGISLAALWVRDVLLVSHVLGTDFLALNGAQIVSNGAGIVGFVLFARAFRAGGLALPGSVLLKAVIYLGALGIAVALTAIALWDHVGRLGQGTDAVGAIASDLGDLVGFAVVAPILLTALALRGGVLAGSWFILVMAQLSWLVYDVIAYVGALPAKEGVRCLACLLTAAAGLAQRRALAVLADRDKARLAA